MALQNNPQGGVNALKKQFVNGANFITNATAIYKKNQSPSGFFWTNEKLWLFDGKIPKAKISVLVNWYTQD